MATGSARAFQPTPPPVIALDELEADATGPIESLAGCYLLRLDRIDPPALGTDVHYDGTLRVSTADALLAVSGDLYVHPTSGTAGPKEPDPAAGIPIFPREDYRFYVRGISFHPEAGVSSVINFDFELHAYDRSSGTWQDTGLRRARLQSLIGANGQPLVGSFEGLVRSSSGEPVGRLHVTRVSQRLRRAVVELDRVPKQERPFDNGTGTNWQTVFDLVGWDLTVEWGNSNIVEPSGEFWTDTNGALASSAYLLSQEKLVEDVVGDVEFVFGASKTFQVSLSQIATSSSLDLGALVQADVLAGLDDAEALRPILALDDIRI